MIGRGEVVRGALATAVVGMSGCVEAKAVGVTPTADVKIRSALLHLGMSMWGSYCAPGEKKEEGFKYTRDVCPTEPKVWNEITALMHERHYNQAVIDLGGGVEFPSHPEITVKGSRSAQWMRDEVRRLADMGIEAVPKLNFSAAHDAWLGIYERMLGTPKYREVVKDLIADAAEMFGNPRFIHLGLDEEHEMWQAKYPYSCVRRGEVWWRDFEFYLDCLETHNARAIVFGSSPWVAHGKETFFRRMPKSVVQNVGMYGHGMTLEKAQRGFRRTGGNWWEKQLRVMEGMFREMSDHGYDIISCASNCEDWFDKRKFPELKFGKDFPQDRESIAWLHDYMAKEVAPERLIGGMSLPWTAMEEKYLPYWRDGINQLADAMDAHGWRS